MKHLLLGLLTFTFFLGIPGCCDDHFVLVEGLDQVTFRTEVQELPVSSGAIVGDTLTMELWMEYESYTDAMIPMSLTTELYGLSCPPYILANYLTGLEITSSNDFNDIPAGQLLNDIIKDENTGMTISELIAEMQLINAYRFADLTLSFLEKPELPEHQFHFLFTDNAGNTFSGHSETIVWQ
jgi:hypothetical protein